MSNKLFYRIREVADLLGVKPYVLRFWETEFPMVRPVKSASGHRVYQPEDVETLRQIKHLLYVEQYSIAGARKRIRELRRGKGSKAGIAGFEEFKDRVRELAELARRPITDFFPLLSDSEESLNHPRC